MTVHATKAQGGVTSLSAPSSLPRPVMGGSAWFLMASGALLLDTTGVVPQGARALLVAALFLTAALQAPRTASIAFRSLGVGLAVAASMTLAYVVARCPVAIAFGVWMSASWLFHRNSRLGAGVVAASALLWPVLIWAETAQGSARLATLAVPLFERLEFVAPGWNGSPTLLQVFPQAFLLASATILLLGSPQRRRGWFLAVHFALVLALNVLILRYWHEMVASIWTNLTLQVWPTSVALLLLAAHSVLATVAIAGLPESSPASATSGPRENQGGLGDRKWRALAPGVAMLLAGAFVGSLLAHGAYSARLDLARLAGVNVLILDEGQLEHKSPTHDVLGMYSDGMFGTIDDYLRCFGAEPRFGMLSPESLEWADVVFLINPPRVFGPEESEWLRAFLRRGGGLLCAGDHTCTDAIRDPINALTEDVGIRLRCDSAVAFQRHWLDAMRFLAHPVNQGFDRQEHAQVWIGASLQVRGPHAFPLLVGSNAFSDAPDFETAGFLGDLTYNVGERMGDIVVAAGAEPPAGGRLIVFGDTSMLQNTAASASWMYLQRALLWLSGGAQPSPASAWIPAALLMLGLAATLAVLAQVDRPSNRPTPSSVSARWSSLATVLIVGASLGLFATHKAFDSPRETARVESPIRNLAVIDRAHGNRLLPLTWGPDAVHGLEMSLTREGLTPVTTQHWTESLLRSSRVLAVIAPTHDIDERDARLLRRYLERGGTVLLSISPNGAQACPRLCLTLGIEVQATPLARPVVLTRFGKVSMYDAHPIRSTDGAASVIARSATGEPVIIWKPVGQGGVLATGDPGFWVNKNLEDKEVWQTHNVHALWEMLRTFGATEDES